MICQKCKQKNIEGSKFCSFCGSKSKKIKTKKSILNKIMIKIFKLRKKYIFIFIFLLLLGFLLFLLNENNYFDFTKGVEYTKNPTMKTEPYESVVKIIVNMDEIDEGHGSGLLFTDDGHILTNAHVVSSELGKPLKDITICYYNQEINSSKCEYSASVVDSDYDLDLAVIKLNKKISEVKPYLLIVEEDFESIYSNVISMGSPVKVIGYPHVGYSNITMTKGIVSGYKNEERIFYDGSMKSISVKINTDTEINFGNSGGAVFDEENRYIGIPSYFLKDDGGKIGYIISWNEINKYLNKLIIKDLLKLPSKQYIKMDVKSSEKDLWAGINLFIKEDYDLSKIKLNKYLEKNPEDSRALNTKCLIFIELEQYDDLNICSQKLRSLGDIARPISWFYTFYYNFFNENPNNEEAYNSINKALDYFPSNSIFLIWKAIAAFEINKIEEAEEVLNNSIRINSENPYSWYLKGLIEMRKDNMDRAVDYWEYSFLISPNSLAADSLAEAYYYHYDDEFLALKYAVAGAILDSSNPENFEIISKIMLYLFLDFYDDPEIIDDIKDILEFLDVDRSLIELVENISNEDLKLFIAKEKNIKEEEITDKEINAYKFYIKMISSWLYTFIGEKDMCKYYFNGKADELLKTFETIGFSKEDSIFYVDIYLIMLCLCEENRYSEDIINKCYNRKQSDICGDGKSFTSTGECLDADQICKKEYGVNSYAGTDDYCYCNAGYAFNSSGTSCIRICPTNSHYSNGACHCNIGYQEFIGVCYTNNEWCKKMYGFMSYWCIDDCCCNGEWEYYEWWGGWYCSI